MKSFRTIAALGVVFALGYGVSQWTHAPVNAQGGKGALAPTEVGWKQGKGWGPWGENDEVGALNSMSDVTIKDALAGVKTGKVYDLGVNYDAESYKWPGHNPGVIMTYRAPEGV